MQAESAQVRGLRAATSNGMEREGMHNGEGEREREIFDSLNN